jgi:hypothetical protein
VERRERHLGRADEVEVVVGQLVDLVGVRAEEAGALHRLGPHERRRDDRVEAASTAEPIARLSSASSSSAPHR